MVTTGQYGYFWLQLSDDYDGLDSLCLRICRIFLAYEGGRKEEGKKDI